MINMKNVQKKVRYTKETKDRFVESIITGHFFLEEAMMHYGLEERRIAISWLRKYLRDRNNPHSYER
ncbi:hypothetical protein D3C87_760140 [compost metagenome]